MSHRYCTTIKALHQVAHENSGNPETSRHKPATQDIGVMEGVRCAIYATGSGIDRSVIEVRAAEKEIRSWRINDGYKERLQ
jgi:hypothetical protein